MEVPEPVTCPPVVLNSLTLDGATPDGDQIVWHVQELLGWFDSAPASIARQPRLPEGEFITTAHVNARALTLTAIATTATPDATKLGDLVFDAMETAKTAVRGSLYVPVVMTVTDAELGALHALVRLADGTGVKTAILGDHVALKVQWLLLAEDPARYEADNTTKHD